MEPSEERPTVVCVGRLCRQKGQDVLLAAWPGVLSQIPDAQLVLVGDGPDGESIRDRADGSVSLLRSSPASFTATLCEAICFRASISPNFPMTSS